MGSLSTFLLACTVGLSVGLPNVLDDALKILADTDSDYKGFYKAMEAHDFTKAGKLYDSLKANEAKLKKSASSLALLKVKQGVHTERFVRLAEVQIKVLVEKMGALINNEKEDEQKDVKGKAEAEIDGKKKKKADEEEDEKEEKKKKEADEEEDEKEEKKKKKKDKKDESGEEGAHASGRFIGKNKNKQLMMF